MESYLLLQLTYYSLSGIENSSTDCFSHLSGDYAGMSLPLKLKHTDFIYAGISSSMFWTRQWILIGQKWYSFTTNKNNFNVILSNLY